MVGMQEEMKFNNFAECLEESHKAEDLPFWEQVYKRAFPTMIAMLNHRKDGDHQRAGIDRSIILENSKQLLIDEKIRGRNKITRKVYNDIALEYLSDKDKNTPGWVCRPLLADYIAYAIAPLGKCYLLPVQQLQLTWQNNNELWRKQFPVITAKNKYNGYYWETISCCVPVNVLFKAIGQCLRVSFEQFEYEMEV